MENLPLLQTGAGTFPSRAYLNHLSEFLVHPLLEVRRHGRPRTLSASVPEEGGGAEESGKPAQAGGTSHGPTRQWGSGKERPLPAARLSCRCAAGFGRLRHLRRRKVSQSESVAQGAGLLVGGAGWERLKEPMGDLGSLLLI